VLAALLVLLLPGEPLKPHEMGGSGEPPADAA
jgi:hypothetical protein